MKESLLRYERGTVKKKWRGRVPVALVFPNTYSVGMANLGFLKLYEFLNSFDEIVCERVFWRQKGLITSLESGRRLSEFSLVVFSVPFEGDFPKVLDTIIRGGLELHPEKRKVPVIAGGVALWLNPVPLIRFLDGALLGEIEALGNRFVETVLSEGTEKESLLKRLSEVEGFVSLEKRPARICKTSVTSPLISSLTSPYAEFGRCQLVEVARGCSRNCRFCAAGYIYRPPRNPSLTGVSKELFEEKVGLVGLESLNLSEVERLSRELMELGKKVSFSSLRVDSLRPTLKDVFSETKTLTLAIEAGSEGLRRRLNKHLSEEVILEVAEMLRTWAPKKLKLYFMFGLPGETQKDLSEAVRIAKEVKVLSKKKVSVSLSPFVPKPFTPFQWEAFEGRKALQKKAEFLRKEMSKEGIAVSVESLREAELQAILSRGGRETWKFLETLLKTGFSRAVKSHPEVLSALKERDPQEPLPWEEFVDSGIKRDYLLKELKASKEERETPFCEPQRGCKACGMCS